MKLDELAERAGVTARTIRYYIQRGLLPAPAFRGPDTAYEQAHLDRLKAIRRLLDEHLPLDAIAARLDERAPLPAIVVDDEAPKKKAKERSKDDAGPEASRLLRTRLAPGLDLLLDDDAPKWVRALAETLTKSARREVKDRTKDGRG